MPSSRIVTRISSATPRPEPLAPVRSALGRADLLRYLAAVGSCEALPLADRDGEWFGYLPCGEEEVPPESPETLGLPAMAQGEAAPQTGYNVLLKRHKARLYGVVERETRATGELEEAEPRPWDAGSCEPLQRHDSPPRQPLIPWPRFLEPLTRALKRPGPGAVDWERVVQTVAERRPLRHWPRRNRPRWSDNLIVILDFGPTMQAYRDDILDLRHWLLRWRGGSGLVLHHLLYGPEFAWSDGLALERGQRRSYSPPRRFPEGAQVLIVSDLGRLSPQADAGRPWQGLLQRLRRSGADATVLCPMADEHLGQAEPWLQGLPALCWNGATPARLRRFHRGGAPSEESAALVLFMSLIALLRRVDTPLLRALRQVHPRLARDAGLEGQAWCHSDMEQGGRACWIAPERQQPHLERLRAWMGELGHEGIERFLDLVARHHQGFNRGLVFEESLRLSTHLGERLPEAWRALSHEARAFFASLRSGGGEALRWYAREVVHYADPETREREHRVLLPLRDYGYPGERTGNSRQAGASWLVQQGGHLMWQSEPAGRGQFPLAGPLNAAVLEVREGNGPLRIEPFAAGPQVLALLEAAPISVDSGTERLTIAALDTPWWALEAGQDSQGAYCLAPLVTGESERLPLPLDAVGRTVREFGTAGAMLRHGLDEEGNWYLDLELGDGRKVTQRFRWIPPGEFLMGSPEDEPQRFSNEGPQHRVILTEGYWLADTACTQAFWQAVLGDNPSQFTEDPQNPVETVSWEDTQRFLKRLGQMGGVAADLPSEAQWEYACRAGTETPFWWGQELDTKKANYDGNTPYADGKKGEYRARTLPVKSFRPNPWGLWQMHGNVWEWCRDGRRDYGEKVELDPEGPKGGENRALRGGSWISYGRALRAADRYGDWPGHRDGRIGFRFLLRSLQPSARRAKG
jgi:formylglycine-generating enzyme required for sulfatase activity